MPDLGLGVAVKVDLPDAPTFQLAAPAPAVVTIGPPQAPRVRVDSPTAPAFKMAPPASNTVLVMPISGPPGPPGADDSTPPAVNLTILFDNSLA